MNRFTHAQRARAIALVAALVIVGVQRIAYAYAGASFLNYLATFVIGPAAILAIVVALLAAMLRPDLVAKALWCAAICIVVFFVIREGDTLINLLQSGS